MEIEKDKWITVAHENIERYIDRGGTDQGDIAELLEGTQLLNTIGIALNVQFSDPASWTEDELHDAEDGQLCFFKGDSRQAIDIVLNKIAEACNGDKSNFITVLPIQLYTDGKLYSLSIFRFRRNGQSKWKFVDNIGRVYSSFKDWQESNVLPEGKVCYPMNGHLTRNSNGYVQTRCKSTPFGSNKAKFMKNADIGTGIIGIVGAVGTLFISGGAALPFVVAGIGSAIYTTTRSVYHLVDRGSHGQTLSPFDNHETFSLWLGIGANLISFGAMGATIRLSTLAFQGKNITNSLRIFVNLMNGTSLTVNSVAVANSLAYMALHFEEMSAIDVLMQVASIAFWAKSVFSYKPAAKIVREIHNQVLNGYSTAMGHTQEDFNKFRAKFNNDKQLVKFYFRYLKQGLDPAQVSDVLVEIYQMGASAKSFAVNPGEMTVSINGHTFTMDFLITITSCDRQTVFNILASLTEKETEILNGLRSQVQDDIALFFLIANISKKLELDPEETAHGLIRFWKQVKGTSPPSIKITREGNITMANGHMLNLLQLIAISKAPCIMELFKNILLKLNTEDTIKFTYLRMVFNDDMKFFNWICSTDRKNIRNTTETMLELKGLKLNEADELDFFDMMNLEENSEHECGVVSLKDMVRISIFSLAQLDSKSLNELLEMMKILKIIDGKLENFHERFGLRIQSEHNRMLAKEWFENNSKKHLRLTSRFVNSRPDEMSQLYRIKSLLCRFEESSQQFIVNFVFTLNPRNISEFCVCCDFSTAFLQSMMSKLTIEQYRVETQKHSENMVTIRKWREKKVIGEMRNNCKAIKLEFAKLKMVATRNKMHEKIQLSVNGGLSDKELIRVIIDKVRNGNINVKFDSDLSAVTQIFKRSKYDVRKFVERANSIIKDSRSKAFCIRCQEGMTRLIDFSNNDGKVELLEASGNIALRSFIEYEKNITK